MKNVIIKLCKIFGVVLCVYIAILSILTNFNIGNILAFSFGVMLILCGFVLPELKRGRLKLFAIIGICGYFMFFGLMSLFIFVCSFTNETDFTDDAVVVLGCALHGETPSPTLYRRLEQAVIYAEKNPRALIVVSGGQGPQEAIPEAEAMARYLIQMGVDKNRIIVENKSSSTSENFKYTKQILDTRFKGNYTLCYITNEFHSYRASRLARLAGLDTTSFNCKTDVFSFVPLYLRECLAVIKLWVFKY